MSLYHSHIKAQTTHTHPQNSSIILQLPTYLPACLVVDWRWWKVRIMRCHGLPHKGKPFAFALKNCLPLVQSRENGISFQSCGLVVFFMMLSHMCPHSFDADSQKCHNYSIKRSDYTVHESHQAIFKVKHTPVNHHACAHGSLQIPWLLISCASETSLCCTYRCIHLLVVI